MPTTIHPTAVVEPGAQLGIDCEIQAYAIVTKHCVVGDRVVVHPFAVIGGDPQYLKFDRASSSGVHVGSDCVIREHVTIHKPCYGELTVLGDDVYLMHGSYVAHDARLGDKSVLAQNAVIGGVSRVLEGGYVAMGAALHQRAVVGQYAIVGAAAAAVKCVRPFTRFVPGQPVTVNEYAIERHGFSGQRDEIERYVQDGRAPDGERLALMISEFERLSAESGRGRY